MFNFIIYADYTTLSCTVPRSVNPIDNFEFECRLKKELCGTDEWLKVNKLSLNVYKSKFMLFNAGNTILYPFEIQIYAISNEIGYVLNVLGLIMDEHLNWKSHVEKISNKCSKTITLSPCAVESHPTPGDSHVSSSPSPSISGVSTHVADGRSARIPLACVQPYLPWSSSLSRSIHSPEHHVVLHPSCSHHVPKVSSYSLCHP